MDSDLILHDEIKDLVGHDRVDMNIREALISSVKQESYAHRYLKSHNDFHQEYYSSHTIKLPFDLPAASKQYLAKYQAYKFSYGKSYHSHGTPNAADRLMAKIVEDSLAVTDVLVNLGGKVTKSLKLKISDVHDCMPFLSSEDYKRRAFDKMVLNSEINNIFNAVDTEYFSTDPNASCARRCEDCFYPANVLFAQHSVYDIKPTVLFKSMKRHGCSIAHVTMIYIPELLVQDVIDASRVFGISAYRTLNNNKLKTTSDRLKQDKVVFLLTDGKGSTGTKYEHDWSTYSEWLKIGHVHYFEGCTFNVEISFVFCGMAHIVVQKVNAIVPHQSTVYSPITYTTFGETVITLELSWRDNLGDFTTQVLVPETLYEKIKAHLSSCKLDGSLSVILNNLHNYVNSVTTRLMIGTNSISTTESIVKIDHDSILLICLIQAMQNKTNNQRILMEFSKRELTDIKAAVDQVVNTSASHLWTKFTTSFGLRAKQQDRVVAFESLKMTNVKEYKFTEIQTVDDVTEEDLEKLTDVENRLSIAQTKFAYRKPNMVLKTVNEAPVRDVDPLEMVRHAPYFSARRIKDTTTELRKYFSCDDNTYSEIMNIGKMIVSCYIDQGISDFFSVLNGDKDSTFDQLMVYLPDVVGQISNDSDRYSYSSIVDAGTLKTASIINVMRNLKILSEQRTNSRFYDNHSADDVGGLTTIRRSTDGKFRANGFDYVYANKKFYPVSKDNDCVVCNVPEGIDAVFATSELSYFHAFEHTKLFSSIAIVNINRPTLVIIEGVPGCGKTQIGMRLTNDCDVIATQTAVAAKDLKQRLLSIGKPGVVSGTVDSLLLNTRGKFDKLIVDEAYMNHVGLVFLLASMYSCNAIVLLGDRMQVPFLSFIGELKSLFCKPPPADKQYFIDISRRITLCSAQAISASYNCLVRTTNKNPGYPDVIIGTVNMNTPGVAKSTVLTMEQHEKQIIMKTLGTKISAVRTKQKDLQVFTFEQEEKKLLNDLCQETVITIAESQGTTKKNTMVVRTSPKDYPVNRITSNDKGEKCLSAHGIVGLTRHTNNFGYLTVVDDTLCEVLRRSELIVKSDPELHLATDEDWERQVSKVVNDINDCLDVVDQKLTFVQYPTNVNAKLVLSDLSQEQTLLYLQSKGVVRSFEKLIYEDCLVDLIYVCEPDWKINLKSKIDVGHTDIMADWSWNLSVDIKGVIAEVNKCVLRNVFVVSHHQFMVNTACVFHLDRPTFSRPSSDLNLRDTNTGLLDGLTELDTNFASRNYYPISGIIHDYPDDTALILIEILQRFARFKPGYCLSVQSSPGSWTKVLRDRCFTVVEKEDSTSHANTFIDSIFANESRAKFDSFFSNGPDGHHLCTTSEENLKLYSNQIDLCLQILRTGGDAIISLGSMTNDVIHNLVATLACNFKNVYIVKTIISSAIIDDFQAVCFDKLTSIVEPHVDDNFDKYYVHVSNILSQRAIFWKTKFRDSALFKQTYTDSLAATSYANYFGVQNFGATVLFCQNRSCQSSVVLPKASVSEYSQYKNISSMVFCKHFRKQDSTLVLKHRLAIHCLNPNVVCHCDDVTLQSDISYALNTLLYVQFYQVITAGYKPAVAFPEQLFPVLYGPVGNCVLLFEDRNVEQIGAEYSLPVFNRNGAGEKFKSMYIYGRLSNDQQSEDYIVWTQGYRCADVALHNVFTAVSKEISWPYLQLFSDRPKQLTQHLTLFVKTLGIDLPVTPEYDLFDVLSDVARFAPLKITIADSEGINSVASVNYYRGVNGGHYTCVVRGLEYSEKTNMVLEKTVFINVSRVGAGNSSDCAITSSNCLLNTNNLIVDNLSDDARQNIRIHGWFHGHTTIIRCVLPTKDSDYLVLENHEDKPPHWVFVRPDRKTMCYNKGLIQKIKSKKWKRKTNRLIAAVDKTIRIFDFKAESFSVKCFDSVLSATNYIVKPINIVKNKITHSDNDIHVRNNKSNWIFSDDRVDCDYDPKRTKSLPHPDTHTNRTITSDHSSYFKVNVFDNGTMLTPTLEHIRGAAGVIKAVSELYELDFATMYLIAATTYCNTTPKPICKDRRLANIVCTTVRYLCKSMKIDIYPRTVEVMFADSEDCDRPDIHIPQLSHFLGRSVVVLCDGYVDSLYDHSILSYTAIFNGACCHTDIVIIPPVVMNLDNLLFCTIIDALPDSAVYYYVGKDFSDIDGGLVYKGYDLNLNAHVFQKAKRKTIDSLTVDEYRDDVFSKLNFTSKQLYGRDKPTVHGIIPHRRVILNKRVFNSSPVAVSFAADTLTKKLTGYSKSFGAFSDANTTKQDFPILTRVIEPKKVLPLTMKKKIVFDKLVSSAAVEGSGERMLHYYRAPKLQHEIMDATASGYLEPNLVSQVFEAKIPGLTDFHSVMKNLSEMSAMADKTYPQSSLAGVTLTMSKFHKPPKVENNHLISNTITPDQPLRSNTAPQFLDSVLKRNLDPVKQAFPRNVDTFHLDLVDNMFRMIGAEDIQHKLTVMGDDANKVRLSPELLASWLSSRTGDQISHIQPDKVMGYLHAELDVFNASIKLKPKARIDSSITTMLQPLQVILAHPSELNTLFGPIFVQATDLLQSLFKDGSFFAIGMSRTDMERVLDQFVTLDQDFPLHHAEVDTSNCDKSQDLLMHKVFMYVMKLIGIDEFLIDLWDACHTFTFNRAQDKGISFWRLFQNSSGQASTTLQNCIVTMVTFCWVVRKETLKWVCVIGDDVIAQTDSNIPLDQTHVDTAAIACNFAIKVLDYRNPFFSGCLLVRGEYGLMIMRDVLRVLCRLGDSSIKSENDLYDKFVSFRDSCECYKFTEYNQRLAIAMEEREHIGIANLAPIIDGLYEVSRSYESFAEFFSFEKKSKGTINIYDRNVFEIDKKKYYSFASLFDNCHDRSKLRALCCKMIKQNPSIALRLRGNRGFVSLTNVLHDYQVIKQTDVISPFYRRQFNYKGEMYNTIADCFAVQTLMFHGYDYCDNPLEKVKNISLSTQWKLKKRNYVLADIIKVNYSTDPDFAFAVNNLNGFPLFLSTDTWLGATICGDGFIKGQNSYGRSFAEFLPETDPKIHFINSVISAAVKVTTASEARLKSDINVLFDDIVVDVDVPESPHYVSPFTLYGKRYQTVYDAFKDGITASVSYTAREDFIDIIQHCKLRHGKKYIVYSDCPVLAEQSAKYLGFLSRSSELPLEVEYKNTLIDDTTVKFFGAESIFSNMHLTCFTYNGKVYNSVEQAYLYAKCRYFGRHEIANRILKTDDPKQMKAWSKQINIKTTDSIGWQHSGVMTMKAILLSRRSQDVMFARALRRNKGKSFYECSRNDVFWGTGSALGEKLGNGTNNLGLIMTDLANFYVNPLNCHKQ